MGKLRKYDYDFDPERTKKIRAIREKWKFWNSNDIELYKPLPPWQEIVKDIEFLTNEDHIQEAFEEGYDAGQAYAEEEYERGYEHGLRNRDEE